MPNWKRLLLKDFANAAGIGVNDAVVLRTDDFDVIAADSFLKEMICHHLRYQTYVKEKKWLPSIFGFFEADWYDAAEGVVNHSENAQSLPFVSDAALHFLLVYRKTGLPIGTFRPIHGLPLKDLPCIKEAMPKDFDLPINPVHLMPGWDYFDKKFPGGRIQFAEMSRVCIPKAFIRDVDIPMDQAYKAMILASVKFALRSFFKNDFLAVTSPGVIKLSEALGLIPEYKSPAVDYHGKRHLVYYNLKECLKYMREHHPENLEMLFAPFEISGQEEDIGYGSLKHMFEQDPLLKLVMEAQDMEFHDDGTIKAFDNYEEATRLNYEKDGTIIETDPLTKDEYMYHLDGSVRVKIGGTGDCYEWGPDKPFFQQFYPG